MRFLFRGVFPPENVEVRSDDVEELLHTKIIPTYTGFYDTFKDVYRAYRYTTNAWPEGVFYR